MSNNGDVESRTQDVTERQRPAGRSQVDALDALLSNAKLQRNLQSLSDRQLGQVMFDQVWEALELMNPALSIVIEATHRLFRSPVGARRGEEVFNDLESLPTCPRCGERMLHHVGLDECDYRKCTALQCGVKVSEDDVHR